MAQVRVGSGLRGVTVPSTSRVLRKQGYSGNRVICISLVSANTCGLPHKSNETVIYM